MISATLLHLHLSDLERVVRHGWWQWRISRKAGWGLCFETNSMKCCHTITHQIRSRFEQNLLAELLFFGSMILKSLRSSLALRCMMYTYIYIYTHDMCIYIYIWFVFFVGGDAKDAFAPWAHPGRGLPLETEDGRLNHLCIPGSSSQKRWLFRLVVVMLSFVKAAVQETKQSRDMRTQVGWWDSIFSTQQGSVELQGGFVVRLYKYVSIWNLKHASESFETAWNFAGVY